MIYKQDKRKSLKTLNPCGNVHENLPVKYKFEYKILKNA